MSRFALFFYVTLLLAAFAGLLAVVAPPLAITPVSFMIVYLPGLAFALFVAWALSSIRYTRALVMWATTLIYGSLMLSLGVPVAAFFAILFTLGVFTIHAFTNRTKTPAAPPMKVVGGYPWSPESPARQVH